MKTAKPLSNPWRVRKRRVGDPLAARIFRLESELLGEDFNSPYIQGKAKELERLRRKLAERK